jgi:hypothetical protein
MGTFLANCGRRKEKKYPERKDEVMTQDAVG